MSETCDFCKLNGNHYESLDFKDTGLWQYGDGAIICKSCLKDLKKLLDKFWEEKTPAHYKCGCLQHELNVEYSKFRDETEDRPEYKDHWKKDIKSYLAKICRCRHINHESYMEFSNSRDMVKLIEDYVGPWKRNFQS